MGGKDKGADEEPQVDNPYRTRLETLKTQLVDEVKELKKCLKVASQDVGKGKEGKSWVGKTADKWHDEIEGNRGRMIREIDKLIPAVQKRINELPEKVSASSARMMNKEMQYM
ncbi:hypothetical protein OG453_00865 [Streptomyces sp. NBC_01381]|uniref:hypothetical protein n=1 Tax=Streptomyces sp. NBC_01381 TaxID=2903845 RepID=UPI002257BDB3|nr:hypothetical protein [Streptomyces sp. NBC_01381]MCX4665237.1 hypothetical protein [Streptomyces sp. NBC_01381]